MHSPIKRNILQQKINTKKLKPGLGACYDIRPGNGDGIFLFQRFINLSLTYLLRHLPLNYSPMTHKGRLPFRHQTNVILLKSDTNIHVFDVDFERDGSGNADFIFDRVIVT